jgi:hypothetical protein
MGYVRAHTFVHGQQQQTRKAEGRARHTETGREIAICPVVGERLNGVKSWVVQAMIDCRCQITNYTHHWMYYFNRI